MCVLRLQSLCVVTWLWTSGNISHPRTRLSSPLEKLGKQFPVLSYSRFSSTVRKVEINSIKVSVVCLQGVCQLGAIHTKTNFDTWQRKLKCKPKDILRSVTQTNTEPQSSPGMGTQHFHVSASRRRTHTPQASHTPTPWAGPGGGVGPATSLAQAL